VRRPDRTRCRGQSRSLIGNEVIPHKRVVSRSNAPKVVQHQSAATAPAETSFRTILYEPLTCASDLH
jgi:hypothetical protein